MLFLQHPCLKWPCDKGVKNTRIAPDQVHLLATNRYNKNYKSFEYLVELITQILSPILQILSSNQTGSMGALLKIVLLSGDVSYLEKYIHFLTKRKFPAYI